MKYNVVILCIMFLDIVERVTHPLEMLVIGSIVQSLSALVFIPGVET